MRTASSIIIRIFLLSGFVLLTNLIDAQTARDIHYGTSDKQVLDYWKAARPGSPVLIFIHGGNAWADKEGPFLEAGPEYFSKLGYAAVNIDYRHPGNTGYPETMRWPMPLRDLACAVAFVKRNAGMLNGDPERVILVGYSAGGYMANMHAHTCSGPIQGSDCLHSEDLSVMAVVSMAAWKIGLNRTVLSVSDSTPFEKMDVINFVNNSTRPSFFILHGTHDQKVGSVEPFVYYRLLKQKGYPVSMEILDGKGHGILFNQPGVNEHIEHFLEKLLEGKHVAGRNFIGDVRMEVDRGKGRLVIRLPKKLREEVTVRFFNGNRIQTGENFVFDGRAGEAGVQIPEELLHSPVFYVSAFSNSICQTLEIKTAEK